ncbi:hypothetical protein M3Y95_00145700 [Aphelenchoides besseyi]|nr:hypothetical protein M3Y95_00145700 [Aphelenchoides besseyi]
MQNTNGRLLSFTPFTVLVVFLIVSLVIQSPAVNADDNLNSFFFRRNAKWINLAPSGGSLVSGRGGFRPGFYGRGGSSMYMNAFKVGKFVARRFLATFRIEA